MSKKVQPFENVRVEICRNCRGAGVVFSVAPDYNTDDPSIVVSVVGKPIRCPVCEGTGRVRRTARGEITIEPYATP